MNSVTKNWREKERRKILTWKSSRG